MTILKPNPVSTDVFNYDGGVFVSEASTVGPLGRVYDDACDVGLTLVSARTGMEVVYVVDAVTRDREGEVVCEILKPANVRDSDLPLIHLFND